MTIDTLDTQRADSIYRIGPETLAARSYAIFAGPVSRYAKQVTETSQPGPDGMALKWVVSGRLEQPRVLKGQAPPGGVVPFIRPEQTGMLPQPPSVAAWERDLADLEPHDEALLFFQGDAAKTTLKVLPDRGGEQGLAALVRDAVGIQALPDAQQQATTWLAYLGNARSDDARRAALRALVANPAADWAMLQPALQHTLAVLPPAAGLRAYVAGIVAFGAMHERWGAQTPAAVDFVCRQFEATQDANSALQQVLTLKLLLNHLSNEDRAALHRPLRQRIFQSLKQRAAAGPMPPSVQQQVEQIRQDHPGEV